MSEKKSQVTALSLSAIDEDDIDSVSSTESEESHQSDEQPVKIADKEAKWVNRSKVLVVMVTLAATALTAYAVYHYTSQAEEQNFEYQVSQSARASRVF